MTSTQAEALAASLSDAGIVEAEGNDAHLLPDPLSGIIMMFLEVS